MAEANVIDAQPRMVRKSFIVTVDVDESRSYEDIKFISLKQDRKSFAREFLHSDEIQFIEGQEELAAAWMSVGNGALPLNLFMSAGVEVAPAPTQDVHQALGILHRLYDNGDLDCLYTEEAYASLRQMEALLVSADSALRGGGPAAL
jgi:hypothetical protein